MTNRLIIALLVVIIALVGALAFVLGQRSREPTTVSASTATVATPVAIKATIAGIPTLVAPASPVPKSSQSKSPALLNAGEFTPVKNAKPFTEKFDVASLTFLPTRDFRILIRWRTEGLVMDGSCSPIYSAREKIEKIEYAWSYVIKSFRTWNSKEGQQEYMVDETQLPNAFQGSLHDIVREGRTVTIQKLRCGMGQVEGLVSVKA